jgi:hypothetical protein
VPKFVINIWVSASVGVKKCLSVENQIQMNWNFVTPEKY